MKKDIFIDGETGTTGLQVHDKLSNHPNVKIMPIDQSKRKDISYKKEMLAKADVTFLCLPDESSIETVRIADQLGDKSPIVIDASTAHRTNPNWAYGLPELGQDYRNRLTNSKRIASPGCYSTGANVILKPLISNGIIGNDIPIIINNENYKDLYWYKKISKISSENNTVLIDLMDYIDFKKKPFYFHSCDGHWSKLGNLFAASIFLENYKD